MFEIALFMSVEHGIPFAVASMFGWMFAKDLPAWGIRSPIFPKSNAQLLNNWALAFVTSFCFAPIISSGDLPSSLSATASSTFAKTFTLTVAGIKFFDSKSFLAVGFNPGQFFVKFFWMSSSVPLQISILGRFIEFIFFFNNLTKLEALGEEAVADPSPASSCSMTGIGLLTKSLDGFEVTPTHLNPETISPGFLKKELFITEFFICSTLTVATSEPPEAWKIFKACISLKIGAFFVASRNSSWVTSLTPSILKKFTPPLTSLTDVPLKI